jgi:hypothetical protein
MLFLQKSGRLKIKLIQNFKERLQTQIKCANFMQLSALVEKNGCGSEQNISAWASKLRTAKKNWTPKKARAVFEKIFFSALSRSAANPNKNDRLGV